MNTPEKIAGVYLRINGFFLMPHFTLFDGVQHTHVDFLGLRAPHSREECGDKIFPLDDHLFDIFDKISQEKSKERLLSVIIEVKGNKKKEWPGMGHMNYIERFLGTGSIMFKCLFRNQGDSISKSKDNFIEIPLKYAFDMVLKRINWIETNKGGLSKESSWTWSETMLSDILYIKKLGYLNTND